MYFFNDSCFFVFSPESPPAAAMTTQGVITLALEHITHNMSQKMKIRQAHAKPAQNMKGPSDVSSAVVSPRKSIKIQSGSVGSKSGSGNSPRGSSSGGSKRPRYASRHRRSGSNVSVTSLTQTQKHQAIARELCELQFQDVSLDFHHKLCLS